MSEKSVFIAPGAVVVGDVTLEDNVNIWYHATVRGDDAPITIGKDTNVQDNAVLHVDEGVAIHIGERVTIGHSAVVHGCEIGDDTLVGMGAIILNHAKIGKNCLIGAGTLITQNKVIPDGSLVLGRPGKVMRLVTPEEIQENKHNAAYYVDNAKKHQAGEFPVWKN